MATSSIIDAMPVVVSAISAVVAAWATWTIANYTKSNYNLLKHQDSFGAVSRSMQLAHEQITNDSIVEMHSNFRSIRKSINLLDDVEINKILNNPRSSEYITLLNLLNLYELWGIGVSLKGLSENFLKMWWGSTYVKDIVDLSLFIARYRETSSIDAAFLEAARLASNWAKDPNDLTTLQKLSAPLNARSSASTANH